MADPCQEALDEFRKALEKLRKAYDDAAAAPGELKKARKALKAAQNKEDDATRAAWAALRAWDAFISELKQRANFGETDVEAGFVFTDPDGTKHGDYPIPADADVVSPIPVPPFPMVGLSAADLKKKTRTGTLWGRATQDGDTESLGEWEKAAEKARAKAKRLAAAAEAALKALEAAQAALKKTEAAAAAAVKAMDADPAIKAAQDDLDRARQKARKACRSLRAEVEIELANGLTVTIEIGASYDSDLHKALQILGALGDKEVAGLAKVLISKDAGGDTTYTTSKGKKVKAKKAGAYAHGHITIYTNGHDADTVKHEIGHNVWENLSDAEKKKWRAFWEANKDEAPEGKMPTEYAGSNENEGFAEVYEAFRDDEPLDADTKKRMKEILDEFNK